MFIALFPKDKWSKEKIVTILKSHGHSISSSELRTGFSHIVLVQSDDVDFSELKSQDKIIIVSYDQKDKILKKIGFLIEGNEFKKLDVEYEISNDKTNFIFDIKNFGYRPLGIGDFKTTIQNINNSHEGYLLQLLKTFDCEDLIDKEDIPVQARKLIVDIYGLIAASFEVQLTLHASFKKDDSNNYIKFYSSILCCTFLVRSEIEKIILLVSILDPAIDHKSLQGSKSIRRSFRKMAENSSLDLTKELVRELSNIEILDDNYRTPEAHKMSRIFGILNNLSRETYGTLINEVISYLNWANQFYKKLCDGLRT